MIARVGGEGFIEHITCYAGTFSALAAQAELLAQITHRSSAIAHCLGNLLIGNCFA